MSLKIDHREPTKLKDAFKDLKEVSFENLPAGDFEFFNSDGVSVLLIERKELEDLLSSLVDGRFDDQKLKLSKSVVQTPRPIAFLIEGNYRKHPDVKTFRSVMATTQFRDGFFVVETTDYTDTAACIRHILDLVKREKFNALSGEEQHKRFISSRASHRSGGGLSRKDDWWSLALSQIDGVGPKAATAITSVYPTTSALITAYQECQDDGKRAQLLSTIVLTAGNTRRLGPKLSEKVWKTVCSTEKVEKNEKDS